VALEIAAHEIGAAFQNAFGHLARTGRVSRSVEVLTKAGDRHSSPSIARSTARP
jgi:hypothetical protein